jgi:hypothetical protein
MHKLSICCSAEGTIKQHNLSLLRSRDGAESTINNFFELRIPCMHAYELSLDWFILSTPRILSGALALFSHTGQSS